MKKKGNRVRNATKFSEEEMRLAVLRVAEDGDSINRVSQEVGLCKKTLKSYVDKYLAADTKHKFIFRPNYEINQVFTHELEKIFEEYLLNFDRTTQRINREYVRKAAFEFALSCNLHVPKKWNICRQAGLDWMYGFLKRHPVIKHTVTFNKKFRCSKIEPIYEDAANEKYVEEMEEEIVALEDLETYNLGDENLSEGATLLSPITVDIGSSESSPLVPENVLKPLNVPYWSIGHVEEEKTCRRDDHFKLYFQSGQSMRVDAPAEACTLATVSAKTPIVEFGENLREAYCAISQDGYVPSDRVYNCDEITLMVENPFHRNVAITACCLVSANGHALPPFMVFPHTTFKESMLRGYASGVCGVASVDGMMDDMMFMYALQHFRDLTHASPMNKAVLVIDDDDSHITVRSIDYCNTHGIELVTLPPHCAGRLQPMSRYVYRTLKSYFNNAYTKFRVRNPDQYISMYDMSRLFNTIYLYSFTKENIIRGFNETGVYPLDEKIFADIDAVALKYVNDDLPPPLEMLEHHVELIPAGIQSSSDDNDNDSDGNSCCVDEIKTEPISRSFVTEFDRNLAENFERPRLEEYFDSLVFAYNQLNNHGGILPDRVFNMDEIELVVRLSENEDSDLRLAVCCMVSANGKWLPPFFVYPGNSLSNKWPVDGGIEGAQSCTVDQFVDASDLFVAMLEHFVHQISPTPDKRVLLIIDDKHGHITVKSMDFCHEHGIILVTVPPYSHSQPHVPLQPLQKTLFKTLTSSFSAQCNRFLDESRGPLSISLADMISIFKDVYWETFSTPAILASFEDAGIWPLSEEKMFEESFS